MEQGPAPLHPAIRHGLHPELRAVASQLHHDFDHLAGAAVVDRVLDEVAARFSEARVRTYLPLLVHRYAKSELRVRLTTGGAARFGMRRSAAEDAAPETAAEG